MLEVTLNGDNRPVIWDGVMEPHLSPTPNRPQYNPPTPTLDPFLRI
jgi:hypothetical protein